MTRSLWFAFAAVTLVGSASAQPCSTSQTTDTPMGTFAGYPEISGDGSKVVVSSPADPLGTNPEGDFELFLYDLVAGSVAQLTSDTFDLGFACAVDHTGARIAFTSGGDFTGQNSDGSVELFLLDVATSAVTQITDHPSGISDRPYFSPNGSHIAFVFTGDLVDDGLPNNGPELYLYEIGTGVFRQLTTATAAILYETSMSIDASRVVFVARWDPLGTNADLNYEVFMWDASAGIQQITISEDWFHVRPNLNEAGTHIVFEGRSFGASESTIFRHDITSGFAAALTTTALHSPNSMNVSSNGERIAYISANDFVGTNPDGNIELFLYEVSTAAVTQLTDTVGPNQPVHVGLDALGAKTVFHAGIDLLGSDPDGSGEAYVVGCALVVDVADVQADAPTPLHVNRNPIREAAEFTFDVAGVEAIDVFSAAGRLVATLPATSSGRVRWTDVSVEAGVYFAKLRGVSASNAVRIVVTR